MRDRRVRPHCRRPWPRQLPGRSGRPAHQLPLRPGINEAGPAAAGRPPTQPRTAYPDRLSSPSSASVPSRSSSRAGTPTGSSSRANESFPAGRTSRVRMALRMRARTQFVGGKAVRRASPVRQPNRLRPPCVHRGKFPAKRRCGSDGRDVHANRSFKRFPASRDQALHSRETPW